jgi:acetyl-CoA C-acetyltransferase
VIDRHDSPRAGVALARIVSTGVSALSPELMGLGPVEASCRALRAAGLVLERLG